ncbi:hypothetical protein [Nocardioides daphniae]|uniref:hypothetical protein n=1 Tax=Nocardioides daphniae TaxID=402297 RepID=UPI001EE9690C|nr:hypothetical protein [Nocardioides daphniae]
MVAAATVTDVTRQVQPARVDGALQDHRGVELQPRGAVATRGPGVRGGADHPAQRPATVLRRGPEQRPADADALPGRVHGVRRQRPQPLAAQ